MGPKLITTMGNFLSSNRILSRLDAIDERLNQLGNQVKTISVEVHGLRDEVEAVKDSMADVKNRIAYLEAASGRQVELAMAALFFLNFTGRSLAWKPLLCHGQKSSA